jgi:hypothetical protein
MDMRSGAAALAFAWLAASAARADVIDGAWCHERGEKLTIEGPAIVTPAGTPTQGFYSRHYFRYVVPNGEQAAGSTIEMRLLNEETMQLRTAPSGPVQTWHRCSPEVSWLPLGPASGG